MWVHVSVRLHGFAREIHNSGAINILIPYNYTGSHTHMHTHALSLSGGILIHFLVITLSIKQTNSEGGGVQRGENWGEGEKLIVMARPRLGELSRRRRDGEGRLSFLFLPCARSYSYFVPKCYCTHRCLLTHSVSSIAAAPGQLALHLR